MKKLIGLMLIAAFMASIASIAYAEEGNKFVDFWRKVFKYPAGVAKESVNVTTEAAKGVTRTAAKTTEAAAGVVTGDIQKTQDLVVEPVKGSVETTVQATEGTLSIPVKAAEEEAPQAQ